MKHENANILNEKSLLCLSNLRNCKGILLLLLLLSLVSCQKKETPLQKLKRELQKIQSKVNDVESQEFPFEPVADTQKYLFNIVSKLPNEIMAKIPGIDDCGKFFAYEYQKSQKEIQEDLAKELIDEIAKRRKLKQDEINQTFPFLKTGITTSVLTRFETITGNVRHISNKRTIIDGKPYPQSITIDGHVVAAVDLDAQELLRLIQDDYDTYVKRQLAIAENRAKENLQIDIWSAMLANGYLPTSKLKLDFKPYQDTQWITRKELTELYVEKARAALLIEARKNYCLEEYGENYDSLVNAVAKLKKMIKQLEIKKKAN